MQAVHLKPSAQDSVTLLVAATVSLEGFSDHQSGQRFGGDGSRHQHVDI